MGRINRTVVTTNQSPQPLGSYSLGIAVTPGRILYVAGRTSVDPSGSLIGKSGAADQTRQALNNIGHVIAYRRSFQQRS